MRVYDLILKKRNGLFLNKEEINFLVNGYLSGIIPDYQISALLMAIYFNGLSNEETKNLTIAMVESGDIIDLSNISGIKVDKHSTGGVGDKISLIVIPLIASLGIPVAKISGRGLGHTGGTIDKLESVKGFNVELSKEEFAANVKRYNMAITSQTSDITPADKKLYSLRDVTATVDSIPLIASSIMSKKIASGADCIVLDVKVGYGAFIKSIEMAKELGRTMVDIGKELNKKTIAVITDMNQPLGYEIGNANEIKETIEVLSGSGPEDVTVISLTIASYMAILAGAFDSFNKAYKKMNEIICSGKALKKFEELIKVQGGDTSFLKNTDLLPKARYHIEIKSSMDGYIKAINAEEIGVVAMMLGAGRKYKGDIIDYSAGITLTKKVNDVVKVNENLCVLHTNISDYKAATALAKKSFIINKKPSSSNKFIYAVIE